MRKKWLFLTLLVIILFGIGGVVLWKFPKKDNSVNQPTPQPHPGPPGKLSQAELEKYLLEKRLDLQNYFVIEKDEEFEECFFWKSWSNENGQIFKGDCNSFYLKVKTPTVHLKNKSEALELIKTDPVLAGKV